MILETALALAVASFAQTPPVALGRLETARYVRQYEAAALPVVNAGEALHREWGDGFYPGSDQAIRMSKHAQSMVAACPRSVRALGRVKTPVMITAQQRAAFTAYHAEKMRMYQLRCQRAKATVAFIDEPEKPSRSAALERANKAEERVGNRAGKKLRPVFRQLGMRYPKDWA